MEEGTGFVRFTASLDPRAQEFRPNDLTHSLLVPFFIPPQQRPQLYFPYNAPPLPPHPLYLQRHGDLPFCPQYSTPPAFVSSGGTRTLVLYSVPSDVSETTVRRELEVFGEVRGVQMERVEDGIVTVHFYDLRHARRALSEIQEQHMHHQNRLRAYYSNTGPPPSPPPGLILGASVWAQFTVPASNAVPNGSNQGTIVVFNLDPEVSTSSLKKIFGAFEQFASVPSACVREGDERDLVFKQINQMEEEEPNGGGD